MGLWLDDIGGDSSEAHQNVRATLEKKYGAAIAFHEIALHYTSGRGYEVLKALRKAIAVGAVAPGEPPPMPGPDEDIRAEVATVLEKNGFEVR